MLFLLSILPVLVVLAASTVDTPLVARGGSWWFTTSDPGASWFALSYTPAAPQWQNGTAPFGTEPVLA
jgi:hypothetical protein